ncbi:MAG: hypothetical protein QOJ27_2879 [Sphingomonadales bacterium]|nr:hypothetical protein [Sphingomonadales bacterium]
MGYNVRRGDDWFEDLGSQRALAKVRELIAAGADPYLFGSFGDPMGLVELERAEASGARHYGFFLGAWHEVSAPTDAVTASPKCPLWVESGHSMGYMDLPPAA